MKAVVLVSGGMDSATLLFHVVKTLGYDEIYALSYEYGQKHNRELVSAAWQCAQLTEVIETKVLDISVYGEITAGASALTDENIKVPALDAISESDLDQPPTYVPNRNMVMLSLAAAFAESRDCDVIFYGAQAHDQYGYWDCTTEFVERINNVFTLNRKNKIRIEAPFAKMKKSDELKLGLDLGVDYSQTWSCYRGAEKACGECPTCIERLQAFKEAGITDPLEYE